MQGEPPTHHETHEPLSGPYPACRERGEEPRGIDSARTVDPVNDASSCEMFHRPSLCNGPDAPTPAASTCKALHPSMLGDEQRSIRSDVPIAHHRDLRRVRLLVLGS